MIFCRGLALPTIRLHGLYTQVGVQNQRKHQNAIQRLFNAFQNHL